MTRGTKIVGLILTLNEELRIERSIRSLQSVTDTVVVVDSESADATRDIATRLGAEVVVHPFRGFSAQRRWAVDYVAGTYNPDFVLSIDADEWLTDDLLSDIADRAASGTLDADVYLMNRKVIFDGRWLRWGGFGRTWLPRMFRPGLATYEDRGVNEHLRVTDDASVGRLNGHVVNDDVISWEDHIAKHNRYSTLEAQARRRVVLGQDSRTTLAEAVHLPYMRRRWLRQHVWDRLPARPAIRFLQLYVLAGGCLDGRAGFRRALFEAWQEMCTDLKAETLGGRRRS
jgi:glycosyltransferase involved in cell wall biosynthesis